MIAHFINPLRLELIGPGVWKTHEPLIYMSLLLPGDIIVPQDFITDLASVPRRPFAFMLAGGRAPAPAVVHDWLYQNPGFKERDLADAILYEAMGVDQEQYGLPEPYMVRWAIWAAVRVAGWHAWRDDKRRADLNPVWTRDGWPEAP